MSSFEEKTRSGSLTFSKYTHQFDHNQKMFPNQIETGETIIQSFIALCWIILTAQMQSGKTGIYCFTAFEMFRLKKIEKILIISGVNDVELREQTKRSFMCHLWGTCDDEDHNHVQNSYYKILNEMRENIEGRNDLLCMRIEKNHEVYFGTELKKFNIDAGGLRKTLIIYDESHYAQNFSNIPAKEFWAKCKINPNGNPEESQLVEREIFIVTVSATPYAEFSSNQHNVGGQKNFKRQVPAKVGHGYIGQEYFESHGNIRTFAKKDGWEKTLSEYFTTKDYSGRKAYGIIRVSLTHQDKLHSLEGIENWDIKYCDRKTKNIASILKQMKSEPERHTLIVIKGFFRMGKELPKEHIDFVMETSVGKTDTAVQGLLGRMCGYHTNYTVQIFVPGYLNDTAYGDDTELSRSIEFHATGRQIPTKAKNIICGKRKNRSRFHHTIPIRIQNLAYLDANENNQRQGTWELLQRIFDNGDYENFNDENVLNDIKEQIAGLFTGDTILTIYSIKKHCEDHCEQCDDYQKTYKNQPMKIIQRFNSRAILSEFDAGCGFSCGREYDIETTNMIVLYIFEDDKFEAIGINRRDAFVICRTLIEPEATLEERIPHSDTKHMWTGQPPVRETEEGEIIESVCVYISDAPVETIHNIEAMKEWLIGNIRLSLDESYPTHNSRKIFSSRRSKDEWNGIQLKTNVYNALKRRGQIYIEVKAMYNVEIKMIGRQALGDDLWRFSSISW